MTSSRRNTTVRSRVTAIAVALVAVLGTACVDQNEAGVGIAKFDSTAVFGIAVEKPVVPGFAPDGAGNGGFDDAADGFANVPDLPRPSPTNPVPPTGPCPPAKQNAFPKASATPQVKDMPTQGLYTWQRDTFILKNDAAEPPLRTLPFALEGRAIRRVTRETEHQFSFDMVAPNFYAEGGSIITSFRVNNNPELLVNRRIQARTIGVVPVPGYDVRVADPTNQPGVFITRIEQQSATGNRISLFQPVQPMLIAPLDEGILRSGQTFQSFGIDAATASVVAIDGMVGRTVRVDACGEIVEGYSVTLGQTLTNDIQERGPFEVVTTQQTRTVDYVFASQFGMLPIAESIAFGDVAVDPIALAARWELGGTTPKPLPDALK